MKNSHERVVEPELLDELPPQDHRAKRSRLDLRRLNTWMNHPRAMARALKENLNGTASPRIVEIGAGDGHFLLRVTGRMRDWPEGTATLVDRLNAFDPNISESFKELGWRASMEISTVSEWLEKASSDSADAIISNLFLHQFKTGELTEMLRMAASRTRLFVALEPRRTWFPHLCGNLLWAIGCNSVTRHDAGISIRAGFSGQEISAFWPDKQQWKLTEHSFGLFSHLFIARRAD
ncbi:MAG TPA: class I SAM-dependent methyltransferase [Pseudomonadales bacterium]|nr:class I SAM-dependent methyltransferase [Pseudomonadales bacterium]